MGGTNSKNSSFDDYPKIYTDVPIYEDCQTLNENNWRIYLHVYRGYIRVFGYSTCFFIQARRPFPDKQKYEFIYQIKIVNKYHLRRRKVIRGVGELRGTESFLSENIYNVHWKPSYNQFNFQAVAYAITDDNGLRKLNFGDENVYGKSTTILATGGSLEVPVQFINKGAPLLANYIDKKKPDPKYFSEEFFQVFHGVHVQLKIEEIRSLLKFAAKFQVFNVKRYCEQQLIRREDLNVSDKKKFKMACKFNLNILMNQVLRDVKSVEELAKLASIAIEMDSMDTNISKLLIARIDENVYGKSTTVLTTGASLEVPIQTFSKGAPLLAKYIDNKKQIPKLKCLEEFFQVFHGVHVQLKIEEIRLLLKFAFKFQVLNVKKYCEHQLIWREDLKVSEKRKFKMACKFNLNILMNQVLMNVKSVKELAKLASIAIGMEPMATNISKLLIAKMYKI